jgi:hypothetical protein
MRYGYCTMIDKRIGQEREGEREKETEAIDFQLSAFALVTSFQFECDYSSLFLFFFLLHFIIKQ